VTDAAKHARRVKTLGLNDEELRLLPAAVRSYLDDCGHEEADVLPREASGAQRLTTNET
jgi:hypothetical protein